MGKGFESIRQTPGCSDPDFNFLFLFVVVLIRCQIFPPPSPTQPALSEGGSGSELKQQRMGKRTSNWLVNGLTLRRIHSPMVFWFEAQ
jgi:hypothetical protein